MKNNLTKPDKRFDLIAAMPMKPILHYLLIGIVLILTGCSKSSDETQSSSHHVTGETMQTSTGNETKDSTMQACPYTIQNATVLFTKAEIHWDNHPVNQVFNPFVMQLKNNTFRMYFTVCDTAYKQALFYSDSEDLIHWTSPNALLTPESPILQEYGFDRVGNCSLVALDEGYRIWFFGLQGEHRRIYSAFTPDGLQFEAIQNVVDIGSCPPYDNYYAYNPFVLKVGAEYRLWYTGWQQFHNEYAKDLRILTAASSDGLHFHSFQLAVDQNQIPPYDAWASRLPGCIVHPSPQEFELFYIGYDPEKTARLLYAHSIDGIHWDDHCVLAHPERIPDAKGLYSPMFVYVGNKRYLWFSVMYPSSQWELWQAELDMSFLRSG